MAVVSKALTRVAASTTPATTLYTVPNTTTSTIVTNIAIANTTSNAVTATVNLDTVAILSGVAIPANSTAFFDLKQVIPANATPKTITGHASSTSVNFHISGVEVS